MPVRSALGRLAIRAAAAALAVTAIGPQAAGASAAQRSPGHAEPAASPLNPFSPALGHSYRQGVVPVRARMRRMLAWVGHHPGGARAASRASLRYGGGIDGIGVTTGREKVYLVFWGSQWGAQGTDSHGDRTLGGDPSGLAPYLQQLFKGLGTGGETWSGVMTQYCEGVAPGATSCPAANAHHVAYPSGGALAGVWADEAGAAPGQATGHQLAAEAIRAAAHFGNATPAANRDAQYLVVSPTGTHPDGFNTPSGGFCAWHDWNGDVTLSGGPVTSPYGDIAFTNLPYVTDAGWACGAGFVNAGPAGLLDGVSIVAGHEYAETITDQDPAGGWTDARGQENADKCAWNSGPGARSADLSLPTGTFAMQPTWGNDAGGNGGACEFTHPVITSGGGSTGGVGSGNTVTVVNPGNQRSSQYGMIRLQIHASDSAADQQLQYSATGLPRGLSVNSATGLISGYGYFRPGSYAVTVNAGDRTGATGSASFTWAIVPAFGMLDTLCECVVSPASPWTHAWS